MSSTKKIKSFFCFEFFTTLLLISHFLSHFFVSISFLLFILYSIFHFFYTKKLDLNLYYLYPIGYFILALISLIWSSDVLISLKGIKLLLPFLLLPISMTYINNISKNSIKNCIRYWIYFIVLFFIILLVRASYYFFQTSKNNYFFYHDLVSLFKDNAIYISSFVSIGLLLFFNLCTKDKKDLVLSGILLLFLILLNSKNLILMTFFVQIIIFIHQTFQSFSIKKILSIFLLFISLFSVLFFIDPVKNRFLNEIHHFNLKQIWIGKNYTNYHWTGVQNRIFQIRIFIEMIQNKTFPLLYGLGINNSQFYLTQYYQHYYLYKEFWNYNFHNQYIQTISELGILGIILLFGFFFIIILNRNKNKKFALILTIIFMSLFISESFIVRQKGITFFCFIFLLFLKYKNQSNL